MVKMDKIVFSFTKIVSIVASIEWFLLLEYKGKQSKKSIKSQKQV